MGEKDIRKIGEEGGNKRTSDKNTTTTSTENTGGGSGRAERKPAEKVPQLVAVNIPTDEKEETKKKRGRPKGSTNKKSSTKRKTKKGDSQQLKILLLTVSGIVASKPSMQAFLLTENEAEQIADPLYQILSNNDGVNAIASEYADHIALIIACLTIFVPKYFVWRAQNPKKKKGEKKNANETTKIDRNTKPFNGKSRTTNHDKTNDYTFNGDIGAILEPIAGI